MQKSNCAAFHDTKDSVQEMATEHVALTVVLYDLNKAW